MRLRLFSCALVAFACVSPSALAQKHGGGGGAAATGGAAKNPKDDPAKGKFTVEHDDGAYESLARSRAAAGDCKGALDAFDAAMEYSVDPELHRDRGLCHEKLGHPYPAIDDYRYYLTRRPNATDADQIQSRLDALLAETGQAPADKSAGDKSSEKGDSEGAVKVHTGISIGNGSVSSEVHGTDSSSSPSTGSGDEGGGKTVDAIDADEKLAAEANSSSLRRGKGFIIGPYFQERRWTKSGYGWGEAVGAAFRYSLGAPSTIVTELGYSQINASGSTTQLGGLMLFGGYEARLGLDDRYTNSIIFQGGLGYERITQGGTGIVASIVVPRGRGGFRHVFGPSVGLELGVDAGYGFVHIVDTSANDSTLVIGGEVALLVGF